ncbi:MAG TPA: DUF6580 family putative transport protein [Acidobacteriaceae bacterium]|jgi:hypothetical protein|nr:DUF6580 family putative transport protein [Acidobacteriaceae bacterium]
MIAYIVLVLAALSRLLPHAFHNVGLNFTAVGAGLLFFGSRRPRWQAAAAVAILALTDVYLTLFVYGFPFHLRGYLVTWAWYAAICLLASGLLRKITALRVVAGVFASATSFFLLSNLAVWFGSGMYPHSAAGLTTCYGAGLPFYANDLLSTSVFAAALFGLPALVRRISEAMRSAHNNTQPLA